MPEPVFFTGSGEANELIATGPRALLIGFALDQRCSYRSEPVARGRC